MEENRIQITVNISAATQKVFEKDLEALAFLHIFLKDALKKQLIIQIGEETLQKEVVEYVTKMDYKGTHPLSNYNKERETNTAFPASFPGFRADPSKE